MPISIDRGPAASLRPPSYAMPKPNTNQQSESSSPTGAEDFEGGSQELYRDGSGVLYRYHAEADKWYWYSTQQGCWIILNQVSGSPRSDPAGHSVYQASDGVSVNRHRLDGTVAGDALVPSTAFMVDLTPTQLREGRGREVNAWSYINGFAYDDDFPNQQPTDGFPVAPLDITGGPARDSASSTLVHSGSWNSVTEDNALAGEEENIPHDRRVTDNHMDRSGLVEPYVQGQALGGATTWDSGEAEHSMRNLDEQFRHMQSTQLGGRASSGRYSTVLELTSDRSSVETISDHKSKKSTSKKKPSSNDKSGPKKTRRSSH